MRFIAYHCTFVLKGFLNRHQQEWQMSIPYLEKAVAFYDAIQKNDTDRQKWRSLKLLMTNQIN
jgi:hypothetical protein